MRKQILSQEYYKDGSSRKFLEYMEGHIDKLEEANVYYRYPALKELDEEPLYPSIFIISPYHGIILIKCDAITKDRDLETLSELENDVSRMEDLLFARFLKSSNKKMKSGKRTLSFPLTSALYVPNYNDEKDLEELSCNVLIRNHDIEGFFKGLEIERIDDDILQEIFSIADASKAIVKPKSRTIDDINSKAYILKKLEEEIAEFDDSQKYAALSQLDGPQRIRGLAGSGKTVILCIKAALLHLSNPKKKILYTFMTKSLYDYIELLITRFYKVLSDGQTPDFENSIHIRHAWGGENIKGVYFDCCKKNGVTPIKFKEATALSGRTDTAFDYVCSDLIESRQGNLEKTYDYVLMDEAQDFKPSFYQLCRAIVKNDCIVWSYDELQNIFDVKIQNTMTTFANKYAKGINLRELQRNHPDMDNDIVLSRCYRNPKEVLVTAHAIGFGINNETLIQTLENNSHWQDLGYNVLRGNCKRGDLMRIDRPVKNSPLSISQKQTPDELIKLYSATNIDDEVTWVCEQIEEAITKDGLRPDDIVVISLDDRYSKAYFNSLSSALYQKNIFTHNLSSNFYEKGFTEDECVTLSTIYKAKGNEAAMIFVIGCDAFESYKNDRKMRNKAFTAFTRAKAWLRISGIDIDQHSLWAEINKIKENKFIMEFIYKEAPVIQRDLDEINAKSAKKRELLQEMISKAKKQGVLFSDAEIMQAFREESLVSDDGSEEG